MGSTTKDTTHPERELAVNPIQAAQVPWAATSQLNTSPGNAAVNVAARGVQDNAVDGPAKVAGNSSFKQLMVDGLSQSGWLGQAPSVAAQKPATPTGGASEVLSAVQKAELSFRTMMQIRDQLVQSYQEIQDIRI